MRIFRRIPLPEEAREIELNKLKGILQAATDVAKLDAPKKTGFLRSTIKFKYNTLENVVFFYIDENEYPENGFYPEILIRDVLNNGKVYGSETHHHKDFMYWSNCCNTFIQYLTGALKTPLKRVLDVKISKTINGLQNAGETAKIIRPLITQKELINAIGITLLFEDIYREDEEDGTEHRLKLQ